jgi:asparagine synthase (glutamine-hydrolysing)
MCGIAGVVNLGGPPPDPALLRRMAAAMRHRGPDDEGFFHDRGAALAFQRLAIIDLSGGHQPMSSDCGRYTVVFNGEIYNFQELRRTLEADHGARFRTRSDTEVILAACARWGPDAVSRFNGMFAFALWDAREQSLLLARDRLGKKPLYYARTRQGLCFGSEVKVLFEHPEVSRAVDRARIPTYLTYRYVPGQETLFAGIECLPPASWMRVSPRDGVGAPRRYWDFSFDEPASPAAPETVREEFRELLLDAVRLRNVADVPVGAFLSGGLDSSVVVGLTAGLHPKPLKTISIGFDTGFSEAPHARRVAEAFGTDHHEILVGSADLIANIPRVLHARESPVTNTSDIPIHLLSRFARTQVTVVLSGEGGDEILAGYPKYAFEHKLGGPLGRLPSGLLDAAASVLPFRLRGMQLALECAAEPDRFERYAAWFGAFPADARRALLGPELQGRNGIHAVSRGLLDGKRFPSRMEEMLYLDTSHWLPANLLLRGDRMTMANSLELRCPFLDYRLVEFAARRVPRAQKVRGLSGKRILKDLAGEVLPRDIVRRRKWGFQVPTAEWFRGPLAPVLRGVLLSGAARRRGYFREERVRELIDAHVSGRRNHDKQLWTLLQLELWHLMFVDGSLGPSDSLTA